MIVDTSIIIAILLDEHDHAPLSSAVMAASVRRVSAGSLIELQAVLTRRFQGLLDHSAEKLLAALRLEIMPVSIDQARIGREAYRRFGIGTGHEAKLNFGDCFAYALAMEMGEPLLFKGDDFIHTDVRRALP